jgi:DNA-binding CsgD family transcriptional regulator
VKTGTIQLDHWQDCQRELAMDDLGKLLTAIDLLYGSTLEDEKFPKALEAIADRTAATGCTNLAFDPVSGASLSCESVGIDPCAQADYENYFSSIDVRIPPTTSVPVGHTITEHSALDEATFKSSEIYGDFLQPHDVPHMLAIWTKKSPAALSALSLQRSSRQGRFSRDDEQKLSPLIPHLLRALQIRDALQTARQSTHAYMEVVHRLPFGMAFIDDACCPIEISDAAQQLLRSEQGLCYKNGRIHAIHPDDDRRLQHAVFQTVTARANQTLPGSTVLVRRRAGKRSLSIAVLPVRSPQLFTATIPSCMLVIFDPENSTQPAVATIKQALQLTEAEALLASLLFTGISLRASAARLDLSINTCKTQLKSIYAKTGCRSHVDLAKTLLMIGITNNF